MCSIILSTLNAGFAFSQDFAKYSDEALKAFLSETAIIDKKVLVRMRDGVGLSTDIYRPKNTPNAQGALPTIFQRTPYNINDVKGRSLKQIAEAVKRGYVFIMQNERGRYFSEGSFEVLGRPRTDGYDALSWIADQPWSNGKVGTLGCSSSAEWQLALAAQNHPAHAAMVPMAAGAGIGRVGRFQEQGNWYTGGVPRSLFFVWFYNVDTPLRAQIPPGLSREIRDRLSRYNDLAAQKPKVDWKSRISHLPLQDMLSGLGEPAATFDDFIKRDPADPAWFEGGLYHDNEPWGVPALWFNSWYDVSKGPNMALYNHVRRAGVDEETRNNQYVVVAPSTHCNFYDLGAETVVGERSMGDARFDTNEAIFSWFDYWLKGDKKAFGQQTPHVRYFTMGANEWHSSEQWPPKNAKMLRFYMRSTGKANSLYGDGALSTALPMANAQDTYVYDPMNPVLTIGGGDCCNGGAVVPGAFDQRPVEARQDVLVYTSEPLEKPMEVSGFIEAVLHVSSDVKDTDFTVKLVDVTPDGTAYILDDTIMRARYRQGYDQEVMMEKGHIYKIEPTPMTTSNTFLKGHRIRVEISSSNFPKFSRNLNTGGKNYDEAQGVMARNTLHLSPEHPSYIILPVIPGD